MNHMYCPGNFSRLFFGFEIKLCEHTEFTIIGDLSRNNDTQDMNVQSFFNHHCMIVPW